MLIPQNTTPQSTSAVIIESLIILRFPARLASRLADLRGAIQRALPALVRILLGRNGLPSSTSMCAYSALATPYRRRHVHRVCACVSLMPGARRTRPRAIASLR